MPGHDHCCVPACTNRRNKCPGLSFHAFPKDDQLRRRWIAAIKRDEGRFFAIGSDTRVCSAHFTAEDYFAQCGPEVLSEGQGRRRPCLKRDAVPSIFSFRPAVTTRPSPSKRRQDALERYEKLASQAKLPKFGPLTELETLRLELKEARERIVSLEHASSALLGENKLLKSQVFRYVNVLDWSHNRDLGCFVGVFGPVSRKRTQCKICCDGRGRTS